jgi:hypothetical protein
MDIQYENQINALLEQERVITGQLQEVMKKREELQDILRTWNRCKVSPSYLELVSAAYEAWKQITAEPEPEPEPTDNMSQE